MRTVCSHACTQVADSSSGESNEPEFVFGYFAPPATKAPEPTVVPQQTSTPPQEQPAPAVLTVPAPPVAAVVAQPHAPQTVRAAGRGHAPSILEAPVYIPSYVQQPQQPYFVPPYQPMYGYAPQQPVYPVHALPHPSVLRYDRSCA